MNNTILVTGGCGFIGSAFIEKYMNEHKEDIVINLDSLTYAGSISNTSTFNKNPKYHFVQGDIQDYSLLKFLLGQFKVSRIVNFAAESHVDKSIANPEIFLSSNVNGTLQLLKVAYDVWMDGPNQYKEDCKLNKFLQVSTDEVYGTLDLESNDTFTEKSHYAPNSPYSASKASAELFVRSFQETYGLNVLTTSCSNNYGERQHSEKLIPHVITQSLSKKSINIHGSGKNIRDWLYVQDHCDAIISVLNSNCKPGSKYNIGGHTEKTNIEIVKTVCSLMDQIVPVKNFSYSSLIKFVSDRPGNDLRYSVDTSKIKKDLNWIPKTSFNEGIRKTVKWYVKNSI